MKRPRITICVPVYNRASYIRQCIESVFAQDYKDWVLLVSDNCSDDGTWEILEQLQHPQMRLFRQPKNIGGPANWFFLLDKIETEFFCVLGSDDYFYPNHLSNKIRLLDEYPEAPFVHGPVDYINGGGVKINMPGPSPGNLPLSEASSEVLKKLLKSNYMVITAVVFRMSSLRKNNIYFDGRLRLFGDWMIFVTLALYCPLIVHDQNIALAYRVHSESDAQQHMNSLLWAMEASELFVTSFEEHPQEWIRHGFDIAAIARDKTSGLWALAFQQLRRGYFSNAQRAWRCYRKFHSWPEVLRDLPRYLLRASQPRKCLGNSAEVSSSQRH